MMPVPVPSLHCRFVASSLRRFVVSSLALWTLPAGAELIRFDAALESRTQEFVAGQPLSFDQVFEELDVTTDELPVRVNSSLVLPLEDGSFVAAAEGFADFFEPVVAELTNPGELGAEANCFSLHEEVSYQVTTSVVERRNIRLSRAEIGPTTTDEPDIISQVFFSGAIIVWSQDPQADLTGLEGNVSLVVEQVRAMEAPGESDPPSQTTPVELFSTSIGLRGAASGDVDQTGDDTIITVFGGSALLLDTAADAVRLQSSLDLLGSVSVLVAPPQRIEYEYPARVDETFELKATFTVDVTNLPGGTGIAAVAGRDFNRLAQNLEQAFADIEGEQIETALAKVKSQPADPADGQSGDSPDTSLNSRSTRACGAMGALAQIALITAAALTCITRMRRYLR